MCKTKPFRLQFKLHVLMFGGVYMNVCLHATGLFWGIARKGDLMSLIFLSNAFNNANLTPDFKYFSKRVNKNPETF